MRENRPSRTAERVALRRAVHQLLDRPLVFDDPLALALVAREEAARLAAEPEASRPGSRFLRAFMAARSRFAEDELGRAVGQGTRQYVILGAGLDTFAYRNPFADLRVFEVDHPATQAWKQSRLASAGIAPPASLKFVPVDFETQRFPQALEHAGFRPSERAFFSWLGVTPYLAQETVLETLRSILVIAAENGVVFDYALPRSSLNAFNQAAFDGLAGRVAAAGEPFRGFFDPEELALALREMGFRHIEDLDGREINARYFMGRADGLRVAGSLAHLVSAQG
jgi:methyltransferase (TIGR00027 family)